MVDSRSWVVRDARDVVEVRRGVRVLAERGRLRLVLSTKLVTATSELARNMLEHAGGGEVHAELVQQEGRTGVRVEFVDAGPGMADPELALSDGYSSGSGMGLGLGGSRRLVHDFELSTEPGKGTRIQIASWV